MGAIMALETNWQTATTVSAHDVVNHPQHYTAGGIETIDYIEAKGLGFHLAQVIKYVSRAAHKGDFLTDLQKARWYLDREIARVSTPPAAGGVRVDSKSK